MVGHAGHDEVIGIAGEVAHSFHLVTDIKSAEKVNVEDPNRVGLLCQTTLGVSDAEKILSVLRRRFPAAVTPPKEDICYATQNRQSSVWEAAKRADVFLVLGSANSSNSNRLREVAEMAGVKAYLLENKDELQLSWLEGARSIGISAGASVPEHLVNELLTFLKELTGAVTEEIETAVENISFVLPAEMLRPDGS